MHRAWYSKAVFTVIAAALTIIAIKLPMGGAALAQLDGCRDNPIDPCYFASGANGLSVNVENWPR